MYKEDLVLNKLQWLICHKTQPKQTRPIFILLIKCVSCSCLANLICILFLLSQSHVYPILTLLI